MPVSCPESPMTANGQDEASIGLAPSGNIDVNKN